MVGDDSVEDSGQWWRTVCIPQWRSGGQRLTGNYLLPAGEAGVYCTSRRRSKACLVWPDQRHRVRPRRAGPTSSRCRLRQWTRFVPPERGRSRSNGRLRSLGIWYGHHGSVLTGGPPIAPFAPGDQRSRPWCTRVVRSFMLSVGAGGPDALVLLAPCSNSVASPGSAWSAPSAKGRSHAMADPR
jgi:hypothetical protein